MEDLKKIGTIHILIATDVQVVENLEGEGFYNVREYGIHLSIDRYQ